MLRSHRTDQFLDATAIDHVNTLISEGTISATHNDLLLVWTASAVVHHPGLSLPVLAHSSIAWRAQIPVFCRRYVALHLILDPYYRRSCTYICRHVGSHDAVLFSVPEAALSEVACCSKIDTKESQIVGRKPNRRDDEMGMACSCCVFGPWWSGSIARWQSGRPGIRSRVRRRLFQDEHMDAAILGHHQSACLDCGQLQNSGRPVNVNCRGQHDIQVDLGRLGHHQPPAPK